MRARFVVDRPVLDTASVTVTSLDLRIRLDDLDRVALSIDGLAIFDGVLQSDNFLAGVSGWQIKQDGSMELQSVVTRDWIQEGADQPHRIPSCITSWRHGVLVFQLRRAVWTRWMDVAVLSGAIDLPGYDQQQRQYQACALAPNQMGLDRPDEGRVRRDPTDRLWAEIPHPSDLGARV